MEKQNVPFSLLFASLGVIDGGKSKGVEGPEAIAWRKDPLGKIWYKQYRPSDQPRRA